jgi:molybdenum cofactor cytidylyltransferase
VITAIVLAAGLSTRMGRPKPLLPWGQHTVIEHILSVLLDCPVEEILVITGHEREAVEKRLAGWPARAVFNPQYAAGEMLSSIQSGLRAAAREASAALIVLGDQPALEQAVVEQVVSAYGQGAGSLIFPSYQRRRGHPLLVGRRHWPDIVALGEGQSLRELFRGIDHGIFHVEVTTSGVLRDMDTPADYARELADHLARHPTNEAQEV